MVCFRELTLRYMHISSRAVAVGEKLPEFCHVVDINLQNPKIGAEAGEIAAERAFFDAHRTLGEFRHWQLSLGCVDAVRVCDCVFVDLRLHKGWGWGLGVVAVSSRARGVGLGSR